MKKLYVFLAVSLLCLLLVACGAVRGRELFSDATVTDRTAAVIEIVSTERSKIDLPETSAVSTEPKYFEVVAAGTTAATTKKRVPIEAPKEYFTVKFVDTDGYTAVSVQTVAEGGDAMPPIMPESRGDLIFRGWDKDYTNIRSGMIVKAIYQKEWLTVRFYDADASLLAVEKVRYGEDATPPEVEDKGNYLFDGWSALFSNVTEDIDVYATYYEAPVRRYTTLTDAYSFLDVAENSLGIPDAAYYRKNYDGIVTVGKNEYAGNVLYGNFCDTLPIEGYGFTSLTGMLIMRGDPNRPDDKFALRLRIEVDGKQVCDVTADSTSASRNFSVDLTGAKQLTIYVEPTVNGAIYYSDPVFVGGLVNSVLYEQ